MHITNLKIDPRDVKILMKNLLTSFPRTTPVITFPLSRITSTNDPERALLPVQTGELVLHRRLTKSCRCCEMQPVERI